MLDRARDALAADPRVAGAWVGGSIAAGATDRWSDVDLRVAVRAGDLERFLDSANGVLGQFGDLLGFRPRPTGTTTILVCTFAGPVRADVVVMTPRVILGAPGEPTVPLVINDPSLEAVADRPPQAPDSPQAVLQRLGPAIGPALGALDAALTSRHPTAAAIAQSALLNVAQQTQLLLTDPVAGTSRSPKAATALRAKEMQALLAPVRAWSAHWPNADADSIAPTLDLLSALADACRHRFGVTLYATPGDPPARPEPRDARQAVTAALDVLIHAPVAAAYHHRGLFVGALYGWALFARSIADFVFVVDHGPDVPVPADPEALIDTKDRDAIAQALRVLRGADAPAFRRAGSLLTSRYLRTARAAAAACDLAYPRRLEREVIRYLVAEDVLEVGVLDV